MKTKSFKDFRKNGLDINEYVSALLLSPRLGNQVVFRKLLPSGNASWTKPKQPWPDDIRKILNHLNVEHLYRHQADAVDAIRSGKNIVAATPTASGKSLIYNLPVIENILGDPTARALYIFPLKALAQDQLRAFKQMTSVCRKIKPTATIYDGDTSQFKRKTIKNNPPNIIMTNPEMLHLSFLAYHHGWKGFFPFLKYIIIDEIHTYRGVMGSHMAQVFRRLLRICKNYGAKPVFILSSATISNPGQLARQLTGLEFSTITKSGAPCGKRHLLFINPIESPSHTAILLLKAALHRGLRTIVYTQSRKLAELIAVWAGSRSGRFAQRISAYRAGFLPEERREIEARLTSGDLLAVISTSALELGIDIGDLDLCLLVGYPGSVAATWQRAGRAGRNGQDSAMVLIAGEDALDQYFMRNPEDFLQREPEAAVINPYNPAILQSQLLCAAAELPLNTSESYICESPVKKVIAKLENTGELVRSADGSELFSRQKMPHRYVNLRGSGARYSIISARTGKNKGEIDMFRAFKETHPGAVYLHQGESYIVNHLDIETQTVKVTKANVNYYTRVRGNKETEILEVHKEKQVLGATISLGRLKVTEQVTGYEKWSTHGKRKLNIIPLSLPPLTFETEGIWIKIPPPVQRRAETKQLHFMGGIHAIEHAAIGIFPLLIMTDRNDMGGISTSFHHQVGCAAVFVYDANTGGAGLCRQAYLKADSLVKYTLKTIDTCPCETGCPSCVHSPKCGSGNRPIDKEAAVWILNKLVNSKEKMPMNAPEIQVTTQASIAENPIAQINTDNLHYGVFDLETQRSFQDVGGWHKADKMGISCVVLYDSHKDEYLEFLENRVPDFVEHLQKLPLVVGFNINRFDYLVLKGYTDFDFTKLNNLDILEHVQRRLNYRLSLDHLARVTLGTEKSANGLLALQWWKEGRIKEIVNYCTQDVQLTHQLFLFGKKHQYLLFENKLGKKVRLPVFW
jgi:DEAD/DEAH box helicase domain-containing protein